MKVKELITMLQQQDPELDIAMPGYEGGYYEPTFTEMAKTTLNLNVHEEWYYGPHETPGFCYEDEGPFEQKEFIILS